VIQLVALDADDTLWQNETLYTATREQFHTLLAPYDPEGILDARLQEVELRNLQHFGYGVKGFILSMIETAIELTDGRLQSRDVQTIIGWGHDMLRSPVELLPGVQDTVEAIAASHPVILLTKGDLLHQETKLARSGLGASFAGIEVVSEKDAPTYRRVMARHAVAPEHFVMVGNSVRSDIVPVLEAGAHAVYVPYEISWAHERVSPQVMTDASASDRYHQIARISDLPALVAQLDRR
jgi:putative hydrolase of the HAD superfamily